MWRSTERFDGRADAYAAFRPGYPPSLILAILKGFDHPAVADVGAGTGISSRALSEAGARVVAVEPNASMRERLDADGIETRDGTAEATGLADESVDLVTAFQAYHWFDPPRFFDEAARILRHPRRIAAVWYHRDRSDRFAQAYEAAIEEYGERVGELDRARRSSGVHTAMRERGYDVRFVQDRIVQPLTWEGLTGFMRSCSYLPVSGPEYDRMIAHVRPIFEEAAAHGSAAFDWTYQAWIGDAP